MLQNTVVYVQAETANTLASNTPAYAINLIAGKNYTRTVTSGEELWFKVDPSKVVNTKTHIKFDITGISYFMSIYNSIDNAKKEKTHSDYLNISSYISYPIAWVGPYYVKIRAASSGIMTLLSEPEAKSPLIPDNEDTFCSGEALAKTNKTIFDLLESLRNFRDDILYDSDLGKEMINVYYAASSSILDEVLFNKSFRVNLTGEILKISTLLKELQSISEKGTSDYILTKNEYTAIFNIYKLVSSEVDDELKSRIDKIWTTINLKEYVGLNLVNFISNSGISDLQGSKSEILVDTKNALSLEEVNAKVKDLLRSNGLDYSVSVRDLADIKVSIDKSYVITINGSSDNDKLINIIKKGSEFKNVSSNISIYALSSDMQYNSQWNLQNVMQKVPTVKSNEIVDVVGKKFSDVDYIGVSSLLNNRTLPKTLIAVVDTGVNYELADLKDVVQFSEGYDFVNDDNDAMDDNSHGTHVTGIIAAKSNNGYSIAGLNKLSSILPIKVLDSNGKGSQENIVKGIRYAVDKGAKVINLSIGIRHSDGSLVSPEEVPQLEEQLKYAYDKGVTVVAAAGNESKGDLSYPANSKYAISVGATDNNDELATFSNWGSGIDMVAPGVSIPSLLANGQVAYLSGTSMSAPHVSAVAGLLYSINNKITPVKVKDIFHKTSTDLDKIGYDTTFGYGRLSSAKALNAIQPVVITNKVTFNSTGGSLVNSQLYEYNFKATKPTDPTKTGYMFNGWYKEAECLNAWVFTSDKVTANTTLYAKWTPQVQRLAGNNRIETSISIAKDQYANKNPDAVVLATANNFADALAGSGLAYSHNAPLLLVNQTVSKNKNVLDYITTNLSKNKNIFLLGGTGVISKEIADCLTTKGYKITRLGGGNRYETNQKIVDYLNIQKHTSIVIATGSSFADALSISSIAGIKGYPILLNGKDNLLASVSKYIANIGPTTVYVIGGTGVLSTNIETQIKKINSKIIIKRIGGKNRYETSMKIVEYFHLTTNTIAVATGVNFPDALSGSVLAARRNCSVLLVDNKDITKQKVLLKNQKITNLIVFGGEGVIRNDIAKSLIQK